ncbi:MAG: CBS domain-containing protein, partial [Oscillospiraceae bacterium]|nr:CBS domain-containing protein [Oscillospiraceae bacterium]
VFFDEGYSRLPVYVGLHDKIVGLLSSKKFMKWFATEHSESGGNAPLPIQDIVKLPTLMKLSDALKSLQRKKSHLAVVLDQYGGTAGIVTLEDILEELVGEIQDESDDESGETAASVKFVKEDVFEVNGELSINDFNRFFEDFDGGNKNYSDIEITSESITIGGWVFEVFGKIPNVGETKSSGRFKVTVLSMEGRRPGRIKLDLTLSQPHKQSKTQAAD